MKAKLIVTIESEKGKELARETHEYQDLDEAVDALERIVDEIIT